MRCRAPRSVTYRGGAPIDKTTGRCPTLRPLHSPSLSRRGKQHDFHAKVHSFSSKMHHSSPLPHTRVTRHAPSHPHSSRGAFFAFTLHLYTYSTDIQMLTSELYHCFCFTEMKAKIEKRRTCPRARKTPKKRFFRVGERGTNRGGPITLAKRHQTGRTVLALPNGQTFYSLSFHSRGNSRCAPFLIAQRSSVPFVQDDENTPKGSCIAFRFWKYVKTSGHPKWRKGRQPFTAFLRRARRVQSTLR